MPSDSCPHCGQALDRRSAGTLGLDGEPLTAEDALLRSRALASLLEERTDRRSRRGGL